jgi:hypothetical protein
VLRRTAIVVVVVGPSALAVGLAFVSQSRFPGAKRADVVKLAFTAPA